MSVELENIEAVTIAELLLAEESREAKVKWAIKLIKAALSPGPSA